MKPIKIAHLYYDLMNLYGENGNIRALIKALTDHQVPYQLTKLSLGNDIDFETYDLIYIGMGSEPNLLLTLDHLQKYQVVIKEIINGGTLFIVTGNALDLFTNNIKLKTKNYSGLGIIAAEAVEQDERQVGERDFKVDFLDKPIIGFENCATKLTNSLPLIKINNFYGTHLIGPLLVRNPYFTEYLVKTLLTKKKLKYHPLKEDISYLAYWEYVNNFINKKQP